MNNIEYLIQLPTMNCLKCRHKRQQKWHLTESIVIKRNLIALRIHGIYIHYFLLLWSVQLYLIRFPLFPLHVSECELQILHSHVVGRTVMFSQDIEWWIRNIQSSRECYDRYT